ncbi:hypothetical protein DPMN_072810 [Dreissena polymorpha]|uniref:SAM domain-containing protein n=1 Tax=Dreissena polymorpha TaxID=45954 RepID=A0A9D4BXY5_DREPO|nr:hypothetical protein DPMN_072810 [Dreissena polymorpha]
MDASTKCDIIIKSQLITHRGIVDAMFPKSESVPAISMGGHYISTNHIPKLQLLQAFDEMYLLGNFIVDGVMVPEVVNVPLYLSQLRICRLTGLKDTPPQKWQGYLEELARFSSYLKYDQGYGNQGIAQYDPSAVHSEAVYSYVQPSGYWNFASFIKHLSQDTNERPRSSIHSIRQEHLSTVNDSRDVLKLSINDVCRYLKLLRLEQSEPAFRENMIDGHLLVELSKDNFEREFGMSALQALRIFKFAKDGHVPK